jgi:hypothetical protein
MFLRGKPENPTYDSQFTESLKLAFRKQYANLNTQGLTKEISRVYQEMAKDSSRVLDVKLDVLTQLKKEKISKKFVSGNADTTY